MSEDTAPAMKPGFFGWNELITSDIETAKKFYGVTFGWESETKSIAGWDYTMFTKDGVVVAGMIGITPEMGPIHPQWLSYVISIDVQADLANARAAGATVLKEVTDVPNVGTFAIIQDPLGATIALWTCCKGSQHDAGG